MFILAVVKRPDKLKVIKTPNGNWCNNAFYSIHLSRSAVLWTGGGGCCSHVCVSRSLPLGKLERAHDLDS